jgi:hypothetical protein
MTELKLCLCGAKPHIEKEKDPFGVYEHYVVLCDKCGRYSQTFSFLPSAIIDWNKRAVRTI